MWIIILNEIKILKTSGMYSVHRVLVSFSNAATLSMSVDFISNLISLFYQQIALNFKKELYSINGSGALIGLMLDLGLLKII